MPDISLDYGVLRGAVTNLEYVARQFDAADDTAAEAAEAAGHDRLSGRLHEFADNWVDTRRRFQAAAEELSEKLDQIREVFETFDHEAMNG